MTQTAETYSEIVGLFHSPDALENAISELASAGWDRAEMSLLGAPELLEHRLDAQATEKIGHRPDVPHSPVISKDDVRQMRTLTTGLAGVVAAFLAAGATVMSGGAALAAVIGAAAAGGGAASALEALGHNADERRERALREQLKHGGILLWVLLRQPGDEVKAREILQRNGATDIRVQERSAPAQDKLMSMPR
jgi:hypothetical protein